MYSIKKETLSDLAEAVRGYFGIDKKIKIEEMIKKIKERVLGEDLVPASINTDGTTLRTFARLAERFHKEVRL